MGRGVGLRVVRVLQSIRPRFWAFGSVLAVLFGSGYIMWENFFFKYLKKRFKQ